ncbi:MAG: type IX secretion system membrane protein PorP/SprF [Marinoscillum sp.]|uniref:PorP/SprF family type IX secretion system membrane protein n=1 Tax=Marinoscillum sp. TaxID=2024838 RepID=UPI0032F3A797
MRKFLMISGLMIWSTFALAQQQFMFTQYMFNGLAINPAYAGSHEALSLTMFTRHQWVGMEGAPNTQTLAIHSPIHKEHIAIGGLIVRDKIGVTTNHTVYGSYAYKIDHRDYHLSFGIQGGFSVYDTNLSELRLTNSNDQRFLANDVTSFLPNVGVGAYFYLPALYVGASIPELITNPYSSQEYADGARQIRHYFFTAGGVITLNHSIKWKPNMMLRLADRSKPSVDINSSFLFNDIIWLGVSYRALESIDLIFELQVSHHLRLGYSYDMGTTNLRSTNSGSHELVLNYRFNKGAKRLLNPRHF